MSRNWTEQQKNAICATDGTVLVSAAAGSGKTAVLVERVIRLITDRDNPIDVDRLLIVTFTRAAAAEMRQRLSDAITDLLKNDPYNPQLLKQRQLLYNASISTIDSFCGDIVREYFHHLDVSRDFRIADEGELEIIRKRAVDEVFEEYYSENSSGFIELVDAFSSKYGDVKLRETVFKISEFLSTQPFPERWMENMLGFHSVSSVAESMWGRLIADYSLSAASHALTLTENSLKIIAEDEKLFKAFSARFEEDFNFLNVLVQKLKKSNWDDIVSHIQSFSAGRLSPPKGYKDNPLKVIAAANRDEVKSTIVNHLQKYFSRTEAEAKKEIAELKKLVATLFRLTNSYHNRLSKLKSEKNVLSFADIELLTVKLLAVADDKNSYEKTAQAEEISSRYDVVMVDEFQDVNDVQDLIFRCVSTNEKNLFVVGDVKQSIYGFRQAKPEIFIGRKNLYKKYNSENPEYPAAIILDKNFRSRREVCSAVNFIFSRLMTEKSAHMDYTEDEFLNVGADYDESNDCDFEIAMLDKTALGDDSVEIEAFYIAEKIRKMMSEGFTVKDGGGTRRATYGDFAILLRSPRNKAMKYVNTLISLGIPAYSDNKENSFDASEIKVILNLLRAIDNPAQDIPLLSVMCSPIYGFSADELAEMRSNSRYINLYASVVEYAKHNAKAKEFLAELDKLREYSYTCSIDELLGRVYESTAFASITAAVKGGSNPARNLNILREYARSYEHNGFKTLSEFIIFIDKLIENGTQLPAAVPGGDDVNGVRVLSIHASKGLEFPVCFIADTAHSFNRADLNEDILLDSHAGLGIRRRNGVCRYNTLPRMAVGIEISQNEIAEELRVLYVALTRAKEKLIIVSSHKDCEKYLSNMYSKLVSDSAIEPYAVIGCRSICDWITLCALVHPSLNNVRRNIDSFARDIPDNKDDMRWQFSIINSFDGQMPNEDVSDIVHIEKTVYSDFDYAGLLARNINFEYKNTDIMHLPQKISASEASHSDSYFERILAKPKFLKSDELSAVERGTAHHKFLQHCDFASARDNINSEVERLTKSGALSEEQAASIDTERISELLKTELFDRIIKSDCVVREEQFFVQLSPNDIFDDYANSDTDSKIIVQGAVDLAFTENGKLVIVDYKTDRIKNISRLVELYEKQLKIYRLAMIQSTEIDVKECIICSLHLDEYVVL